MQPIGPEPPTVYWLRRAAIIVVVLVVLISLFWLFGGRGGSDETAAPVPQPTATALVEASAQPAASPTSTEPVDCPDSAIKVTADTDAKSYQIGTEPQLSMTIQNIGESACLRDVGPKANSLEITSGGFHVWSSDDCNPSDKTKVVVLKPAEKVATSITWAGERSLKGCPSGQGKAKAGYYDVAGTNGAITSDKTKFRLVKSG